MSIASEISRLQTSKADVKTQVNIDKDIINGGTAFIGNETVDDYDDKIEEMQDAYKKFIPIQTATGNSIAQIDNTGANKLMTDISLYGNTEQFTTTGSQLIDFATLSNSNTTNSFANDTLTVVSTGTWANAYKDITTLYKLNAGKTLRFDFSSITFDATANVRIVGLRVVAGTTSNITLVDPSKTITTHTIPSDTSNVTSASLTIYANNTSTSATNTLVIKKPILHFGSTEANYEPYTRNDCFT